VNGPLHGVRVLDLTTVVLGPFATQILGDLGADVIKVEAPEGDVLRRIGPMRHPGMGALFLNCNRNKRSLALDLRDPRGREALLALAQSADVLVHNARPASMRRLRLDYEAVRAANARIVYAGAFGYGQDGPYADYPAYDDLIQGVAGLPWLHEVAGGGEPRYVPTAMADRVTGLYLMQAVTAALFARERTGAGQEISVPMFESLVHFLYADHLGGATFDPPEGGPGYARMLARFRAPYRTKDGYLCVLVYNDAHWRAFFRLLGDEARFERDPVFGSQTARSANIDAVYEFVARQLATRSTTEWLRLLRDADIPVARMNSIADVLADPHLAAVGLFTRDSHPSEGALRGIRLPSSWSGTPPSVRRPAPRLGEHTVELLREAGLADDAVATLIQEHVAVSPSA